MVQRMAPGSVLLDLAAERGGNCELTVAGETVVRHGVTLIGRTNVASDVPYHASQMYARNVTAFLLHIVPDGGRGPALLPYPPADEKGTLRLNLEDEIVRETLLTRAGELVNTRVREFFGMPPAAMPERP
jgi:NAD(P) transhydrogenase subunit alpha